MHGLKCSYLQEQLHRNFDALAGALMLCVGDDGFICGKYCTHPNLNIKFAVRSRRSCNGSCLQCGRLMTALRVRRLFFLLARCCRVWFFVVGVLEFPFMWGLCCLNVMST